MGKTIGSVILGYLVTWVVGFGFFALAFLALGTDGAFRPNSYDIAGVWLALSLILWFIAAIVGGLVCLAVAREKRAAYSLAVVVIVLGIVFAFPQFSGDVEDPGPRTDGVPMLEAIQRAQWPTWLALLNPLAGAAGVLTAVRLKDRKKRA